MTAGRVSTATFWLAAIDAALCLGFGVLAPLLVDWESQAERLSFVTLVVGGGLLLLAGLFTFDRSPRVSAALIGLGGLAGGLGLVETVVVPLAAIALVALSMTRLGRREKPRPAIVCDERR